MGFITQCLDSVEQGKKLLVEITSEMSGMQEVMARAAAFIQRKRVGGETAVAGPGHVGLPSSHEITPAELEIEEDEEEEGEEVMNPRLPHSS